MIVRKRIRAHGHVQGVFFRDSTRREAERLDVRGWVRNCPDNTVEAVLEGEAADVEAVIEFLRAGPGIADVTRLDTVDEEAEGLEGFTVR